LADFGNGRSFVKVLAVVSEIYPLVKTGGLADVAGALPAALRQQDVTVVTLIPGYPAVMRAFLDAEIVLTIPDLFGGVARILAGHTSELDLLVIDAPHLFARPGTPYADRNGLDWPDNALRFAALGQVAARVAWGDVPAFVPDVVHCHDWQAGLTGTYLAFGGGRPRPPMVMTIHNMAFQGQFPAELVSALGLPDQAYGVDGIEYYGGIGFMKAGVYFADRITTVSPTYAKEIQTAPGGCGLEGLLRGRADVLSGILNGIDTRIWNPRTDPCIPSHFDPTTLDARSANKIALQLSFGLHDDPTQLLFGVVSRLAWQKGIDLVADVAGVLLGLGAQLVLLGTGEPALEQRLSALAAAHPGRIGCLIGYDEKTAHLIQAGVDALLVPSRFEPCGLTQLCALRYGGLPVVASVGGLADTVADPANVHAKCATGFQFQPTSTPALAAALRRVAALWNDPGGWQRMQLNGMGMDVSWSEPAAHYATLYREAVRAKT
jgi:starch synthase